MHRTKKDNLLLPVGGQDSLGLVVPGQPMDPALNENQSELGVLILRGKNEVTIQVSVAREALNDEGELPLLPHP